MIVVEWGVEMRNAWRIFFSTESKSHINDMREM